MPDIGHRHGNEFRKGARPIDTDSLGVLAKMPAARQAEGIAIAREMLDRVCGSVQGAQVSAPFGKVELALEVFAG